MGLTLAGLATTLPAIAQTPPACTPMPPQYRLADLVLRIQADGPDGAPLLLALHLQGSPLPARSGPPAQARALPAEQLMAALSQLHALRFFSLPTNLDVTESPVLMPDGTVRTSLLKLQDDPLTTVCAELPRWRRCVSYTEATAPEALRRWVQRWQH